MLSDEQKRLIQNSFMELAPELEEVTSLFYERLFKLDPTLRLLFHIEIHEQQRKLIEMLSVSVYGLDHYDQLIPALRLLGKRHTQYGVKLSNYKILKEALFWALEEKFPTLIKGETLKAWEALYTFLEETMLSNF